MDVGATTTGLFPVPVRLIDCGLPGASSVTVSIAVLSPDVVGVKSRVREQVAPAGSDAGAVGQRLLTIAKSPGSAPAIAIDEIFNATDCRFTIFTVVAGVEVKPINWLGKVTADGLIATG